MTMNHVRPGQTRPDQTRPVSQAVKECLRARSLSGREAASVCRGGRSRRSHTAPAEGAAGGPLPRGRPQSAPSPAPFPALTPAPGPCEPAEFLRGRARRRPGDVCRPAARRGGSNKRCASFQSGVAWTASIASGTVYTGMDRRREN